MPVTLLHTLISDSFATSHYVTPHHTLVTPYHTLISDSSATSHFAASRCSWARRRCSGEEKTSRALVAELKARFTWRRVSGCRRMRPEKGGEGGRG